MFKQTLYVIALVIVLAVVSALGYAVLKSLKALPAQIQQTASSSIYDTSELQVQSPLPNAVVQSPLTVSGEAVGGWYFEAVFPVRLTDANGNVIATGQARAMGDWTTTSSVPFTATIDFQTAATPTGFLILQNDNPSGNPATLKEVKIPVRFR